MLTLAHTASERGDDDGYRTGGASAVSSAMGSPTGRSTVRAGVTVTGPPSQRNSEVPSEKGAATPARQVTVYPEALLNLPA